jgi:hypothetical protein
MFRPIVPQHSRYSDIECSQYPPGTIHHIELAQTYPTLAIITISGTHSKHRRSLPSSNIYTLGHLHAPTRTRILDLVLVRIGELVDVEYDILMHIQH